MPPLLLLLALCLAAPAAAMETRALAVERRGDGYALKAQFHVVRPRGEVFELLTRYDRWHELSPTIDESRLLTSFGPHRHHVRTVSRACVLLFCGKVMQVQVVVEYPPARLTARTLPRQSNLRYGRIDWRLEPEGDGTRIGLDVEITPAFWVPPLLGPWMIRVTLEEEVKALAAALEGAGL